jgi:hypothetical protein
MLNASNGTASVAFQFARRWTKAAILWVMGKGEVINDASGNPMKLVGTVQDITERRSMKVQ